MTYLGQIIAAPTNQGLLAGQIDEIKQKAQCGEYSIWVGSTNAMKTGAARKAIEAWLSRHMPEVKNCIDVKGWDVSSDIDDQPHGLEHTKTGAENRFTHMKEKAAAHDELRFYVSMENGVMQEEVTDLKNRDVFVKADEKPWIDRCFVIVEIAFKSFAWKGTALSEGVTTPVKCVEQARDAKWKMTAGSFIKEAYGFNDKDWHKDMVGKTREAIMQDAILQALGG